MRFLKEKKPDWESEEYKRVRFHYLLQIIYGETLATDYCRSMSTFAPTQETRNFLLKQEEEENSHLELLTDMVSKMERPSAPISKQMYKLHEIMTVALEKRDWPACILIQNFIVEGLSVTLCEQQELYGDTVIQRVFERILSDEHKHVEFGVQELKKLLKTDTDGSLRKRLIRVQRQTLYRAILLFKDLAPEAHVLGVAWDSLAGRVVREHLLRIDRANFKLPWFDKIFLKTALLFFRLI